MSVLISLLGRRDAPTDGIEDYCNFLGISLARRGIELKNTRLHWMEDGWFSSLTRLWRDSSTWQGNWILLQYTALGWSRRGFPFPALVVLAILRRRGLRSAIVFHDVRRQESGSRWIDRVRGACQEWVIRTLHKKATRALFPDPLDSIDWLAPDDPKSFFVPIGANIPDKASYSAVPASSAKAEHVVVVYCLSTVPNRLREIEEIAYATKSAAGNGATFRLVLLGRGTAEAHRDIDAAFSSTDLQVSNLGLQSAEDVRRILSEADAMLCVRGKLYPRRGSALAGVACALPIIGYSNEANIFPLDQAGVILVPYGDKESLAAALQQVLMDSGLRARLRERSILAHQQFFSWDVIAAALVKALQQA